MIPADTPGGGGGRGGGLTVYTVHLHLLADFLSPPGLSTTTNRLSCSPHPAPRQMSHSATNQTRRGSLCAKIVRNHMTRSFIIMDGGDGDHDTENNMQRNRSLRSHEHKTPFQPIGNKSAGKKKTCFCVFTRLALMHSIGRKIHLSCPSECIKGRTNVHKHA